MQVWIRVDSSTEIGTGHVWRCLTLAEELRARGATVQFVCRTLLGGITQAIEERRFRVYQLPGIPTAVGGAHQSWIAEHWREDAELTAHLVREAGLCDWVIVDHYSLDERWESALSDVAERICVIDDLANRPHLCDLLVDFNLFEDIEHRYDAFVDDTTIQLLGPGYAVLRPEFARTRQRLTGRIHRIRRVLVAFGGVDATNETAKVLRALASWNSDNIEVDVVAGAANPHWYSLQRQGLPLHHVTLHRQVDDMAFLMTKADLAIGAGGLTMWERCCLGLPALVSITSSHQRPSVEALARMGCIVSLGDATKLTHLHYLQAMYNVDTQLMRALSTSCLHMVDGLGATRVVDALTDFEALSVQISGFADKDPVFFEGGSDAESGVSAAPETFSAEHPVSGEPIDEDPSNSSSTIVARGTPRTAWGVLVTTASATVPLLKAIRRAMEKTAPVGVLHGLDGNTTNPVRFFVDRFWDVGAVADWSPAEFVELCKEHAIRAVVPTGYRDVLYFAEHAELFKQNGIHPMVSSLDSVCSVLDIWGFSKQLRESDLPGVQVELDINKIAAAQVIVRERYGSHRLRLQAELPRDEAVALAKRYQHPVYQPFVSGHRYMLDMYVHDDGRVYGPVVRKLETVRQDGQLIAYTLRDEELEVLGSKVVEKFGLYGHVGLDVVVDFESRCHIVDCQPWVTSDSTLSMAAGLNSVEWFLASISSEGEMEPDFQQPTTSLRQVRYLDERIDSF